MTYATAGLAALGDPTRRAIFERLADRPCAVGELARELPVSRPAVSQHLKVLKEAGLVSDSPAGIEGPDRTRVELEHRNLERHGDGWEQMRDAVRSPAGWAGGLRLFAERLKD